MSYDISHLHRLGKRQRRLREEFESARRDLATEILAAVDAGVRQVDIVKATGYTRDAIRQMVRRRG